MRLSRFLAAVAVVPLVLAATPSHAAQPSPSTYLALGDSVAAGVGAGSPELGYVSLLLEDLRGDRNCGKGKAIGCRLESVNLAVPGATTIDLIEDQLPAAIALLEERNGNSRPVDDVRLITITIGGNDLLNPVLAACPAGVTPSCVQVATTRLQQVSQNYATILSQLREAAGEDATIAVMTYYNPLRDCAPGGLAAVADLVLEGGGPIPAGLNDVIRAQAAAFGAVVAETGPIIDPTEVQPDCVHPNDAGHADIAEAFRDVVGAAR
jgi:lysophospholipase L1-like esterase